MPRNVKRITGRDGLHFYYLQQQIQMRSPPANRETEQTEENFKSELRQS